MTKGYVIGLISCVKYFSDLCQSDNQVRGMNVDDLWGHCEDGADSVLSLLLHFQLFVRFSTY